MRTRPARRPPPVEPPAPRAGTRTDRIRRHGSLQAGCGPPSRRARRVSGRRVPRGGPARSSASAFVGGSSSAQIIASRSRMVSAMSGRFAATSSSSVSAVSAKPPRRRRTASSRTSWSGTVRPRGRNGQRRTKATINMKVNPMAAAQSLRAAGGIGWRRFRPGSRTLTTFAATRRRTLSNRDESRVPRTVRGLFFLSDIYTRLLSARLGSTTNASSRLIDVSCQRV